MRMHDTDSSSPTTEQNRENVFQLILHINFIFGNIPRCNTAHRRWWHWPYPHWKALAKSTAWYRWCIHPLNKNTWTRRIGETTTNSFAVYSFSPRLQLLNWMNEWTSFTYRCIHQRRIGVVSVANFWRYLVTTIFTPHFVVRLLWFSLQSQNKHCVGLFWREIHAISHLKMTKIAPFTRLVFWYFESLCALWF